MSSRNRLLLTIVIVLSSAVVAVFAALRLIAPGSVSWVDTLGPSLANRMLPDAVCAAIGVAAGIAGAAVALLWRAALRSSDRAAPALRASGAVIAAVMTLLTPGDLIPVAGYSFALVVIAGVVFLAVLLVWRHPWWGLMLIAVVVGLATWAALNMNGLVLLTNIFGSLGEILPGALIAAAHLLPAVALLLWAATSSGDSRGRFAVWVLRHRTAITVIAALCAAPYAFARATWLTPWPLLAPDAEALAENPMVRLTGLALGAAMLAGGLLTLGLIRPWGRRFPRWMGGLGGGGVPVALAVVPASVVAALFTAGGVDMMLSVFDGTLGDGSPGEILVFTFALPFWLWGPLLALATWGYAMARQDAAASAVPERREVTLTRTAPTA